MTCNVCGGINAHKYGCPEAPEERKACNCNECGCELYAGDEGFRIGDKYYCIECCEPIVIGGDD